MGKLTKDKVMSAISLLKEDQYTYVGDLIENWKSGKILPFGYTYDELTENEAKAVATAFIKELKDD